MKVMYTGTFNPWHRGHQNIYDQACVIFGKENVHVVLAKHPDKDVSMQHLKRCLHSVLIPKDNIHINTGLTRKFCKDKGFNVIVRGLRDVKDCPSEFVMADWNDEIQTIFLYCNDPTLRKVSSSAIKEIEHHDPGSTKKYFSKFFQYYRWKYSGHEKFIYFGKIACGKSTYLKKHHPCYVDLDKEIWAGFTDEEISHYKRTIKDCIILNDGPRYESTIAKMAYKINWTGLFRSSHIEASALGCWFKYIPASILSEYILVKIECKGESSRSQRVLDRGLTLYEADQFDKFYKDPPFYDKIVRV